MAVHDADFSDVTALAIDETSRARGHDYVTLAADAEQRRVVFVTAGRDATTIASLGLDLAAHKSLPEQIESVSIERLSSGQDRAAKAFEQLTVELVAAATP